MTLADLEAAIRAAGWRGGCHVFNSYACVIPKAHPVKWLTLPGAPIDWLGDADLAVVNSRPEVREVLVAWVVVQCSS